MKLVLALAFIVTASLTPVGAWAAYILLLALVLSVEMLSELGIRYVLKRAFLAAPFVLAALPLIFTVPGTPIAAFTIGAWTFTISMEGVERVLSIAFKSWVSVQMAIVLAATTPFPELLSAMRALRIPKLLVAIFGLMWRYLFVLVDEAMRLLRARAARSGASREAGRAHGGPILWRARVTGGMAGNLLVRSFERGD
ncbi:MAG: cobalt ECF transporter T component CbiQ, partial [Anaerolineales bacterium]|nr:cobalt ECF transporter T component CbiQ [Anaerolineales bacterium]